MTFIRMLIFKVSFTFLILSGLVYAENFYPEITDVTGCAGQDAEKTTDCKTDGGDVITIHANSLLNPDLTVSQIFYIYIHYIILF